MNRITTTAAKQLDLVDYLASLGFHPDKVRNQDYWYRSPMREEKTASFKVDRAKRLWYDHGKLKVGIAFLEVAFQSKRWNNIPVPQKEIQSFRGSIQGKCEQGIYFTTSTYTKGAKDVSLQKGAVPIILIDGDLMVDIMIEKGFGVEIDTIKVYSVNLEDIFSDED